MVDLYKRLYIEWLLRQWTDSRGSPGGSAASQADGSGSGAVDLRQMAIFMRDKAGAAVGGAESQEKSRHGGARDAEEQARTTWRCCCSWLLLNRGPTDGDRTRARDLRVVLYGQRVSAGELDHWRTSLAGPGGCGCGGYAL